MKLYSWNVNGIRAAIKNGFLDFLKNEKPDILGLQEIKISHSAREKAELDFPGYDEYWNPAVRPGYSGTAILVKKDLISKIKKYSEGMGVEEFDREGRVQTMEFDKFYFVNAYFPNANHELSRLRYKLDFNDAFLKYVKKLENPSTGSGRGKPVVACGDFNVAHEEIDLKNPKENMGNAGFTDEERAWMTKYLDKGLVDIYRKMNKNKIQYSWWSYRFGARPRNIGWRIDYFLVSVKMAKKVRNAFILDKITGSDHAPVGINLEF